MQLTSCELCRPTEKKSNSFAYLTSNTLAENPLEKTWFKVRLKRTLNMHASIPAPCQVLVQACDAGFEMFPMVWGPHSWNRAPRALNLRVLDGWKKLKLLHLRIHYQPFRSFWLNLWSSNPCHRMVFAMESAEEELLDLFTSHRSETYLNWNRGS
jgi:hypothetical protein